MNKRLNFNLQFFAEEGEEEKQTNPSEESEKNPQQIIEQMQAEMFKQFQVMFDAQAKKYEQQISLSGLDEQQRAEAEKDLRIKQMEEKLKEYDRMQMNNEIVKCLSARGLDARFGDYIIADTIEEAQKKIDGLDKLFNEAVKLEIKNRIPAMDPRTSTSTIGLGGSVTKEEFSKMNLMEKQQLLKNNPELYNSLTQ